MKTIETIIQSVAIMERNKITGKLIIGSFETFVFADSLKKNQTTKSVVTFDIVFRPDHIQKLLESGIRIDFEGAGMYNLSETAPRYLRGRAAIKQGRYCPYYYMGNPGNRVTGLVDNWLISTVTCSVDSLSSIKMFARENYLDVFFIDNDFCLNKKGWNKPPFAGFDPRVRTESQYKNLKALRRTTQGRSPSSLLPIQKRVLNKYVEI